MARQIFAVGGLAMDVDDTALFRHLVGLAGGSKPTVCFLPTASNDDELTIALFYEQFAASTCRRSHLELTRHDDPEAAAATLPEYDIVYVGGGATAAMLDRWRHIGADTALRRAWERGTILAGDSAGAMCWFESCVTDSLGDELEPLPGLAFLEGSFCPHYDDTERSAAYRAMVADGRLAGGWGVTDGAALHIVDAVVAGAVSSRATGAAYRVGLDGEHADEQPLAVTRV